MPSHHLGRLLCNSGALSAGSVCSCRLAGSIAQTKKLVVLIQSWKWRMKLIFWFSSRNQSNEEKVCYFKIVAFNIVLLTIHGGNGDSMPVGKSSR